MTQAGVLQARRRCATTGSHRRPLRAVRVSCLALLLAATSFTTLGVASAIDSNADGSTGAVPHADVEVTPDGEPLLNPAAEHPVLGSNASAAFKRMSPQEQRQFLEHGLAMLNDDQDVEAAVQHVCNGAGVRVTALADADYGTHAPRWNGEGEAPEDTGAMRGASGEALFKAYVALRVCGVVILEGVFPPDFVAELRAAQEEQIRPHLDEMDGSLDAGESRVSTLAALRSPGRLEYKAPLAEPFSSAELVARPVLMRLISTTLRNKRFELDTLSHVTSVADATEQQWHRDLPPAFTDARYLPLPPAGLVVFVPLVDVTQDMGPTQFLTGSHLPCMPDNVHYWEQPDGGGDVSSDYPALLECAHGGTVVSGDAPAASAVVFDIRTLHRGGRNRSGKLRPQMYLTYFRDWYQDTINFRVPLPRSHGQRPLGQRKLFARLDARQYQERLEALVLDLGGEEGERRLGELQRAQPGAFDEYAQQTERLAAWDSVEGEAEGGQGGGL